MTVYRTSRIRRYWKTHEGQLRREERRRFSGLFDRYFGLKESLEALYGRRVDLVTAGSLRNPYFVEAVNRSRQLVYAAEDPQAA